MQALFSNTGLPSDSVRYYTAAGYVDRVLLMADLVLYGSFLEEQTFPPLLLRAMSFEIPIIVPSLDIITKYVRQLLNQVMMPSHTPTHKPKKK